MANPDLKVEIGNGFYLDKTPNEIVKNLAALYEDPDRKVKGHRQFDDTELLFLVRPTYSDFPTVDNDLLRLVLLDVGITRNSKVKAELILDNYPSDDLNYGFSVVPCSKKDGVAGIRFDVDEAGLVNLAGEALRVSSRGKMAELHQLNQFYLDLIDFDSIAFERILTLGCNWVYEILHSKPQG